MPITALYASLLAILFIALSFRVIVMRREARVELGTGDSPELLRRMCVHANFAEYAPFTLLLIGLAESIKAPSAFLHVVGLTLVAGRYMHAYGLSQTPHIFRLRMMGMMLTFAALVLAALLCFLFAGLQLII